LGPSNVNNMAAELEKDYDNLRSTQETSRWTFEKHVNKHEDLHNVAKTLVPHGYGAADEGSRVRRLLAGIKTTTLDTIKGQVLGSPTLSKNFSLTVSLFKDFIHQTKISSLATNSGSANVAGVASRDRRQRNGKGKQKSNNARHQRIRVANVKVQDRYYTVKEYGKLSVDQKRALKRLREERTGDNRGESERTKVSQASVHELASSVSSLIAAISLNSEQMKEQGGQPIDQQESPCPYAPKLTCGVPILRG
jgi:hypothetical protein